LNDEATYLDQANRFIRRPSASNDHRKVLAFLRNNVVELLTGYIAPKQLLVSIHELLQMKVHSVTPNIKTAALFFMN